MRKRIGIFCMAAVLVLGSGCGTESTATGTVTESEVSTEQESDHSNTTVTGKITAMNGNEMTLQLGELSEGEAPGGESQGVDSYSAVTEYTEDTTVSDTSFTAVGSDENAVLVSDGATAELTNVTIDRTSSDSTGGNDASFYGVGAAALVTDGTLKISDSTITTDSNGGAGVFAYGDGVAYVSDTGITTQKGTSGGIHVGGGGTLYAVNLEVETNGESSAAIRSDRGGGTMECDPVPEYVRRL